MDRESKIESLLNSLGTADKHLRRKALCSLRAEIFNDNPDEKMLRKSFDQTYLHILKCFNDPAESCRELSILIMQGYVKALEKNDYFLTYILPVMEKRLGGVIIVEESEEIRLLLVQFLNMIVQEYQNDMLLPFLSIFAQILSKTVLDPFPKVKHESCLCIMHLTKAVPKHFHLQSDMYLKSVVQVLGHQHFRIRMIAIQCISDIVEHSGGKISEDALVGLAVAMNDRLPGVRLAVIRAAHAWLMRQPDRYSYFPKILPLILLGLTDEVNTNVKESEALWHEAGKQYAEENEKDFKDKMDYLEEITPRYPSYERPTFGCRMLVIRHTMQILAAVLQELTDWRLEIRQMSSRLLTSVVLHNEGDIRQHLQNLLPAMAKVSKDSDTFVANNVGEAARIVGYFVPPHVYCDIILPVLDGHTGPTSGQLRILSKLISGSLSDGLRECLPKICETLLLKDVCHTRQNSGEILNCCREIITVCGEVSSDVEYELFTIVVTVLSINTDYTAEGEKILENLRVALNTTNLYQIHSTRLLQSLRPTSNAWTVVTPERCIFETLLLQSKINENFRLILEILQNSLAIEADGETRLKLFLALSKILLYVENENDEEFNENMATLVLKVIEPNLIWHAGRLSESIRSAAVVCLCACLPHCAANIPLKFLSTLTGLLEERSAATRTFVLRAIACLAEGHPQKLDSDLINSIYPETLKRLDDGIDEVRIEAAITQKKIWNALNDETYHGDSTHCQLVDFLYSTLLIHLDDKNTKFQERILDVLRAVSKLNRKLLINKLENNKEKFRCKDICEELLDFLK